jgi:hypothetical protein
MGTGRESAETLAYGVACLMDYLTGFVAPGYRCATASFSRMEFVGA